VARPPYGGRAAWPQGPSWLWLAARLGGLVILAVLVAGQAHVALGAHPLRDLPWLAVAAVAWLGWTFQPWPASRPQVLAPALALLGLAGGTLSVHASLAMVFVGAAAAAAATSFELMAAVALAAVGPLTVVAYDLVAGRTAEAALTVVLVAIAGLLVGVGRREANTRIAQAATLRLERERMDLERARADVLSERNHLAREIHDVLAHSLGALSVEPEALDVVASETPDDAAALRAGLAQARRLVTDGLAEARRAVRALREDAPPLADQVAALATAADAAFELSGSVRALPPEATLALYRTAQEALTNARRHAPGARASVSLAFGERDVILTVANPVSPLAAAAASGGGGFGLQGMRERALLLGGAFEAGPTPSGWRVKVRLQL
jgi:signal transduction histidine kinase